MINDGSSAHRLAWDLIPWIVNGTASDSDRQLAETHFRACADCREELDVQRRLQLRMSSQAPWEDNSDGTAVLPDSWATLSARLNSTVVARAPPEPQRSRARAGRTRWLAAAVVLQSVGLAALALALASRPPANALVAQTPSTVLPATDAPYRTLSSAQPSVSGATVRAIFAPQTTLAQLQALLARAHLQIVSGPREGGVWWLAPSPAGVDAERGARELRTDPLVRFAAPAGGAP